MNTRIEPSQLAMSSVTSQAEPSVTELIVRGSMSLSEMMQHAQHLEGIGELKAACNLYALWINHSQEPNKHFALFNFGGLLQTANKTQEAIEAYEAAIVLKAYFPQPYINLGLLHEKLGNNELALASWLRLVSRRYLSTPPNAEFLSIALNHIGRVQENLKNYVAAEEALEQSLLVNPKQAGVIQHWVHIRQKSCKWPIYKELPGISLSEMRRATSPLAMLALTEDPAEQLVTSQSFVARTYTFKEEFLSKDKIYRHEKIRVGYVSADFREHAVGFLLPPMLDSHDTEKYELYAYDYTLDENTNHRNSIKNKFKNFRSIHTLSDRQAAELILSDEIDILVDLHGLSSGARPGIFALHPAPKQGTYLGFIGPTGMPWFDFVISDRNVLPEELSMYFTEKPLYVDGTFIPLVSHLPDDIQRTRKDVGIPEDVFVMGALGNIYKITPDMFASWMRLLKRIPNSLLWLVDDNAASTANLKEQCARHGVDANKILFTARTAHTEFCVRLKLMDVYLDTYPYNCGSTTNDVVNAGVPLVSLYGKTMVSRMGLSILSAIGYARNATRSITEYEDKVVELAIKSKAGKLIPKPKYGKPINMNQVLGQFEKTPVSEIKNKKIDLKVRIQQIGTPKEKLRNIPQHFFPIEDLASDRPDWGGYWAIRHYLLNNDLDDDTFYGFFNADFTNKTNLNFEKIREFVELHGTSNDVLIFSPYWDLNSLFLNSFIQGEFFHPGLLGCIDDFTSAAGLNLKADEVIMHTDNTVFCNYFIAKRRFWQHWLELGEKLFELAEPEDKSAETINSDKKITNLIGIHKSYIQERLVNILLAGSDYKSKAFHPFLMGSSATPFNQFMEDAVIGNALKFAYCETQNPIYKDSYSRLQTAVLEAVAASQAN